MTTRLALLALKAFVTLGTLLAILLYLLAKVNGVSATIANLTF